MPRKVRTRVRAKFSNSWGAVVRRIKGLPKYAVGMIKAPLKRDALRTIKNFHDGIKSNNFQLQKLKEGTIERKIGQGMERPRTPLYEVGDGDKKRSYINMLRIKELKNGWRVHPSRGKHYSGDISLQLLFFVHEYGTIIRGRGGAMIRIPPRPALMKAFRRTLRQRRVKEDAKVVRKAMAIYTRTGKLTAFKQAEKQFVRGLSKYGIID